MDGMTTPDGSVASDLRRLIAEGRISEEALSAITRIEARSLSRLLDYDAPTNGGLVADERVLSPEETTRLSMLSAQLTYGLDIDDDERLLGILQSLTVECHLSLENVARLTGLDLDDLILASRDPQKLSSDTRYAIALRASYLINAANQSRRA
ncbi:HTH domain-containing protein [Microbacterium sp. RURRCA19A]|uniref:HTH domain-containing protein n=1 Tax=Microbacterium sp. RURRCA19A TaxID=1907391 RepID=UPI0034C5EBED